MNNLLNDTIVKRVRKKFLCQKNNLDMKRKKGYGKVKR
jgi:hypothetical protein